MSVPDWANAGERVAGRKNHEMLIPSIRGKPTPAAHYASFTTAIDGARGECFDDGKTRGRDDFPMLSFVTFENV